MKKLIPFLLITFTTLMLSSCLMIVPYDSSTTYTLYFDNNTNNTVVKDWYAENIFGTTYGKRDSKTRVGPGKRRSIENLPKGTYYVYYCVNETYNSYEYEISDSVYLSSNKVFKLSSRNFRNQ